MSDWLDWLQRASFLVVFLVGALATLQRGLLKQKDDTIAGLRGDLTDSRARVADRDAELAEEKRERAEDNDACNAKIIELQGSVDVLSKTVTGEVHLVALSDQVSDVQRQLVDIQSLLEGHAHDGA